MIDDDIFRNYGEIVQHSTEKLHIVQYWTAISAAAELLLGIISVFFGMIVHLHCLV